MPISTTFLNNLRPLHLTASRPAKIETPPASPYKETFLQRAPRLSSPSGRPKAECFSVRGITIVALATLVSLIFISCMTIALVARNSDEHDQFTAALMEVSRLNPGLVLVGQDIDVDINEPSVTIRWSVVACGNNFVLPGSRGLLGNSACGLPSEPCSIYVDKNTSPSINYIPISLPSGHRDDDVRRKTRTVEFESNHVLDVHTARQYPFDSYRLQTELRAMSLVGNVSQPIPIIRILSIGVTPSFNVEAADFRTYVGQDSTRSPGQLVELSIARPGSSRLFALLIFVVNWLLTHISIAQMFVARRSETMTIVCCLAISAGSLVIIPNLRNTMPDGPGLDGMMIDSIGFFPQMVIVGLCVVGLLLILAVRELDSPKVDDATKYRSDSEAHFYRSDRPDSSSPPKRPRRPPPMYTAGSNPVDLAQWEAERKARYMHGEYVFPAPPMSPTTSATPTYCNKSKSPQSPREWKPYHRRSKTVRAISMLEDSEVSKWSDHEEA